MRSHSGEACINFRGEETVAKFGNEKLAKRRTKFAKIQAKKRREYGPRYHDWLDAILMRNFTLIFVVALGFASDLAT